MKRLLWLDDIRNPFEGDWLSFSPIGRDVEVHWVKSFEEFTNWIEQNGVPDGVCFDHDLGDVNNIDSSQEKTGYHCAIYLVDYCEDFNLDIPLYNIQSANPVGRDKIKSLLDNYHRYYMENKD